MSHAFFTTSDFVSKARQKHDKIKTQWAKDNNYNLTRITYKQNLKEELEKIINE